ncbi:peptidoglycan recognition protein [Streptomyces sp. NPDC089799]|uniref:peptidoglycan recognition protein family protein n=1 Tax=Streptomyces sp. NPDC089799 TaxID=3155066 RepID=UPI003441F2E3
MRGFLASSIGVATAAALALPLALATPALAESAAPAESAAYAESAAPVGPAGSTQSLPLVPLGPARDRATGAPGMSATPRVPEAQGLPAREVKTFSLVGVVWDDAATELLGRVQVRTRSVADGRWSDWQDVETHNSEHAADPDGAERTSGRVRGSTAPLWVGPSDGIEVRVRAGTGVRTLSSLPAGMRIELVDPGEARPGTHDDKNGSTPADGGADGDTQPGTDGGTDGGTGSGTGGDHKGRPGAAQGMTMAMAESSLANVPHAPLGATEIAELNKADATADAVFASDGALEAAARPYIGPRPKIITRRGWGADESLREAGFVYTQSVKAAFVHHTASGNNYACRDAPAVLRSLYRYHVVSSGWRDFGYNFAVDKCGNVYEGRAGGIAKPVLGAHTMGFNSNSMGIAVLGTFTASEPPQAAVDAVAGLTAWKLGLFNADPRGKTTLKSAGGNKFPKGRNVSMNVISGHRDGFATECPGKRLYGQLPPTRTASAVLQGRP